MSISTILPAATLKANATRGRPPGRPAGAHTAPGAPSTSAKRAARARPENVPATSRAPAHLPRCAGAHGRVVGPEHDPLIEDRQQRFEVALARGSEEGFDDLPLAVGIGVRGGKLIAWIKDADGNPIGLIQHAPCGRFQHFSFSSNGAAHAYTAKPLRESLVPRTVGYYLHTLAEMLTSEDRRPQRADKPPRAAC